MPKKGIIDIARECGGIMLELKRRIDIVFIVLGLVSGLLAAILSDYNLVILGFFGGFLVSSFVLEKDFRNAVKRVNDPKTDVSLQKVYSNLILNLASYAIVLIIFAIFTPEYCFVIAAVTAVIYRALTLQLVGNFKG